MSDSSAQLVLRLRYFRAGAAFLFPAALFLVFQAPDVALSSLVVSGAAYPLVLVGAIARVRAMQKRDAE